MGVKSDQVAALRIAKAERLEQQQTVIRSIKDRYDIATGITDVVNKAVSSAQANETLINDANRQHQIKWRLANEELNRQRAREGMRKLRAAKSK